MFNAAFTLKTADENIVTTLDTILKEKGFKVEGLGKDDEDTIHIKAVNKGILSVIKHQLKRNRDLNPEAQRVAIHIAVVPDEETESTFLFISVYPIMEFYHLPEIPGVTESEEERETDAALCGAILTELADAVKASFKGWKENYRTLPMKRIYHLPDSRHNLSRDEVEKRIITILKRLKFEVIKTHESEYNLTLEIKAVNKGYFHAAMERLKNRRLSKFVKDTQRITVKFTIFKPKLGYDHKLEIRVQMFPSMEFLGREEIPGITQEIDEEMTDSLLSQDLWEPLVKMLDEEFGPYAQRIVD